MDVRKFTFSGEEVDIAFPFEAVFKLIGPMGLQQYLQIYQSPPHQIAILREGLRHGFFAKAERFKMSDKQVFNMAKNDLVALSQVWKYYDKEILAPWFKLYQPEAGDAVDLDGMGEEDENENGEEATFVEKM